jgi:hypothetical protein
MNDSVLATYSAMQVIAGPPSSIDIDYDPDGEDGGGSVWHIEVAARVQDSRNNNVADGYSVEFTTNSDIAHFENDGVTGNPGPLGSEPQPGVAYSRLLYHSANTNQWITVTASTRRADGSMVESESTFRLPLQEAMGLLYAEPTNWNYTQMTSSPYAVFALEMVVKDGHDHLINDQLVLFNTTHGRFYPTQAIAPNTAPYAITGPADTIAGQTDDDPEGVARRYLLVLEDEAFLDPMSPLTLATVDCIIWGASDATVEPVNLQLMRNIGGQEPGGEATQAQE